MAQTKTRKKRGSAPTKDKIYFSQETENAIIKFNKESNLLVREFIYKTEIEKPLDRLAENIINTFKFPYLNNGTNFDEIKKQVVSFLVINLERYKEGKGKAFSYFSVIAKNHLILNNNNAYRQEKRNIYLSDKTDETYVMDELIVNPLSKDNELIEFVELLISYWDKNLPYVFKKKRDREIASAVIDLFREADGIENFNKKAIYLLIREMTGYETSYITRVVKKMKGFMAQHLKEYVENGTIQMASKFFEY